jgi:DNA ligase-1
MTELLSRIYSKADSDEIAIISYLINGRVAPEFIPAEYNLASKSILSSLRGLASKMGVKMDVKSEFDKRGDLGLVAEKILSMSKKTSKKNHSVKAVYEGLWEIVGIAGSGSVERKNERIINMLSDVSAVEGKYLVRILNQTLRLGSSRKTVMDALSFARKGDKRDRDEIQRAFGVCSDMGYVAQIYMERGVKGTESLDISPGTPVSLMLVERVKDPKEIIERLNNPIVQPKYDGLRCQIHVGVDQEKSYKDRIWKDYMKALQGDQQGFFESSDDQGKVKLFSRNLEDLTDMFPEVVAEASKLNVKSAVFDSEVVGYDDNTDEFATFQSTMKRRRKYNIKKTAEEFPIKAFVFDVLYLDGRTLIEEKNKDRIKMYEKVLTKGNIIRSTESVVIDNVDDLESKFHEKINAGLEGIIAKNQDTNYQPGNRGFDWIKFKRATKGDLADTVDVVILGYYHGRGKQAQFGIGALLGGVYNKKEDRYETLTKIGTGITDEQWVNIKSDLDRISSKDKPKMYICEKGMAPDVWVRPEIVSTVEADEITKSPIHTAGKMNEEGYALRFPRLKKWNRDKIAEESTSVEEVKRMYKLSRKE